MHLRSQIIEVQATILSQTLTQMALPRDAVNHIMTTYFCQRDRHFAARGIVVSTLNETDRVALRAFVQRGEVRLSTMHRVAGSFLSGAGCCCYFQQSFSI